jgi:hypothetical protein
MSSWLAVFFSAYVKHRLDPFDRLAQGQRQLLVDQVFPDHHKGVSRVVGVEGELVVKPFAHLLADIIQLA